MAFPKDPRDLSYLLTGTATQRAAYQELNRLDLWTVLAAYTPALTGTVPLELDVPGSDLDVICRVDDIRAFQRRLRQHFGQLPGYHDGIHGNDDGPAVVASFAADPFPVEVFGQGLLVEHQRAYRHLMVEARVLCAGGIDTRTEIRRLRALGLKTEPAFARFLGLPGDPYRALLALESVDDGALARMVRTQAGFD